ncbi:MAG: phosphoglucosamine mutase [Lentisphaeria bacterium]|jgi:phosphoglucosamine mutase
MRKLFGTDGIRGQANKYPITPEVALRLGQTLAARFRAAGSTNLRALIGKDTRLSGYMLETALTSGLVSMGMDVYLVGPLPTPAVAHLAKSMGTDAGIMLTASHNPFDDNGIKIFGGDGFKLNDALEAEIERELLAATADREHIPSDKLGKAYRIDDASGRYIEFAKGSIGNQSLRGLKVVLDCANGAAYQVAPLIFRELGAEVIKINAEPDGFNINNGCGALHPETAGKAVRKHGAHLGIAFDGDADRVIFTDADGATIDGDRILAMCALAMKAQGTLKDDTLVVTAMSNLGLHDAMAQAGIRVEVTDVGDRYVIERMRAGGFNLGGEKSGHLIFLDYATTGDGIVSAMQVLKLMKLTGKTVGELAACMREYPQTLVSLPVKEKKPLETLPRIQAELKAGLAELGRHGRIVLRYSGTERKIRLLVEAPAQAAVEAWTARLTAAIQADLG